MRRLGCVLAATLIAGAPGVVLGQATNFYFSVDIGSDLEISATPADGNEWLDPGDIYQMTRADVAVEQAFKDDVMLGISAEGDPWPVQGLLPTRVPIGTGSIEAYPFFFDLDGEDQLGALVVLAEPRLIPTNATGVCGLWLNPHYLYLSFDDDLPPGWPASDTPITAGPSRGGPGGLDEILGATNFLQWTPLSPVSDESVLGLLSGPPPETLDDDVDALDVETCRFFYWSCDHEATAGRDPGAIYVTDMAAGVPNSVLAIPQHALGLVDNPATPQSVEDADVDAFEFLVVDKPEVVGPLGGQAGSAYLAVLFSVDNDDPLTPGVDESGGLLPHVLYLSLLNGLPPLPVVQYEDPITQDIDAIALIGTPEERLEDYGDAPDPAYPTLRASGGASHVVVPGGPRLGLAVDMEVDGQPTLNADGDDVLGGTDDEDGIRFLTPLVAGQTFQIEVSTLGSPIPAFVNAWIDFDGNGSWADPGEQILAGHPVMPGVLTTMWRTVPAQATPGMTYARFRISTVAPLIFMGPAPDGEVEDYHVQIRPGLTLPDAKWLQPPDLNPTGMDVYDTMPSILADDFLCRRTGPITNVVVWGSWLHDQLPLGGNPAAVGFTLSFHADIPAIGEAYSRPGPLLWMQEFAPGSFHVDIEATELAEGWFEPPQSYDAAGDTICFRYTFPIAASNAFVQLGEPDQPVVYWLDVQAHPLEPGPLFGWKTSPQHWNDDAVYGQGPEPYLGPWFELVYPDAHPFASNSIDLAFALFAGDAPGAQLDFGDAPDPAYPTLLASDGARHRLVPGVHLGAGIDAEPDGQPSVGAQGDDLGGVDDEDGVVFTSALVVGQAASVDVTASVAGQVFAWVDFNANGAWEDPAEALWPGGTGVAAGLNSLVFTVPGGAGVTAQTYARFRFVTNSAALGVAGYADHGEVEDAAVAIDEPPPRFDFGDAPFRTLLVDTGAFHQIVPGVHLGPRIDAEPDGQPDGTATGDDLSGVDDEDGVLLPPYLVRGLTHPIRVVASVPGYLSAWLDYQGDGDWDDPGETIFLVQPLAAGTNTLQIVVPVTVPLGAPFARFRFATNNVALLPYGHFPNGEVEDYHVRIVDLDYGDAPDGYRTTLAADGARHAITPLLRLGRAVDGELDGQPTADATGDDLSSTNDEDGVHFHEVWQRGNTVRVSVLASGSGYLNAWADFGRDGAWTLPSDRIVSGVQLTAASNDVFVAVPATAMPGETFVRFRYSLATNLPAWGDALNGEVEDYRVTVYQPAPATNVVITNLVVTVSNGMAAVRWDAESNVVYQLQARTNLLAPSSNGWSDIGAPVVGPTNVRLDTNATEATKFYRILVPYTAP
jgi:hypothetical protein